MENNRRTALERALLHHRAPVGHLPRWTARRLPNPTVILLLAMAGALPVLLDSIVVSIAVPDIARSFPDSSVGNVQRVLTSFHVPYTVALPVGVMIAERIGRRATFIAGGVLVALSALGCVLATALPMLLAFRLLGGVGAGLVVPGALRLMGAVNLQRQRRTQANAALFLLASAAVLAPATGGLVAGLGWRALFGLELLLLLGVVVATQFLIVESRAVGVTDKPVLWSPVVIAVGVILLVASILNGFGYGWDRPVSIVPASLSALVFAGLLRYHLPRARRTQGLALIRRRTFAMLTALAAGGAGYGVVFAEIAFFSHVWDESAFLIGLRLSPQLLAIGTVALIVGAVIPRIVGTGWHRVVLLLGAACFGAGTVWLLVHADAAAEWTADFLPGELLTGVGAGTVIPALFGLGYTRPPQGGTRITAGTQVLEAAKTGAIFAMALLGGVALSFTADPGRTEVEHLRPLWWFTVGCSAATCLAVVALGRVIPALRTRERDESRGGLGLVPAAPPTPRETAAVPSLSAAAPAGLSHHIVSVVGLDAGAPAVAVARALQDHLGPWLQVVYADFNGDGVTTWAELDRALASTSDLVLLFAQADADPAWREFCLARSNRVVLVASAPEVPDALPETSAVVDLVLTGPVATGAQRSAWHRALAPVSSHQVDASSEEALRTGLRALAARLAHRSLGLVFAGGGARGFAYLGVLEVLEEAGIPVDRVAGTSMGAVIAATKATGWPMHVVDAYIYEFFVRRRPMSDLTLPRTGLIKGERTSRLLDEAYAGWVIEAMPLEFRCVSVDLLTRSAVVHREGPLSRAVDCSLRLPGFYPPLKHNGGLHVDGGVLDNLPVTTLSKEEGPVIALNLSLARSPEPGEDAPRRIRTPGIGETLIRTMMIGSHQTEEAALAQADFVLSIPTAGIGLLEWHQIDRLRQAGRLAALDALPQIKALLGLG